jgi:hypothetical protein
MNEDEGADKERDMVESKEEGKAWRLERHGEKNVEKNSKRRELEVTRILKTEKMVCGCHD